MIASGCQKWTCDVCGPRRKSAFVRRIVKAAPNRLVTLTIRHDGTIADQLHRLKKSLPRLITALRKTHGSIDYLRMMEECRDGYPHFHLLVRSAYLPQGEIKELWTKLTGATIVDVRKAHGRSTGYVAKYLGKARNSDQSWSRQRVSVSKHFWQPETHDNELIAWTRTREHPTEVVAAAHATTYEREWVGRYIPRPREPGDEQPTELQTPKTDG